jgi:hypothetical protein
VIAPYEEVSMNACAWSLLVLAGLVAGCGGRETEPEPHVPGTCVNEYPDIYDNEDNCVYPGSYDQTLPGKTWCGEYGTFHPLREDGSNVSCDSLGYPIRCSNCTGRDFYYKEGKVCKDCSSSSTGSSTGSSMCDYSGCLQSCIEVGGTNCGEDCKCD